MVLDRVVIDGGGTNSINRMLSESKIKLGGPPAFSAMIRLVLSRVLPWMNPEVLVYAYTCPKAQDLLKKMNVPTSIFKNLVETSSCPQFNLIYRDSNQERELFLKNPPQLFDPTMFMWKKGLYDAIIVGSVYQEFNDKTIFELLAKHTNFIAFDPQGCFRKVDRKSGRIKFQTWWDSSILAKIKCLKLSESEALYLGKDTDLTDIINELLTNHVDIVLITRGNKGACLGFNTNRGKSIYNIPAYTSGKVVDETGAGDVFLSMFVSHYLIFNDILNAASFATSIASLLIERKGIDGNFSELEITQRTTFIRSKIEEIL
ncbi:MAG: PfkB family carbohydrate kinase [Candidatus Hodarchaeales archaeon]